VATGTARAKATVKGIRTDSVRMADAIVAGEKSGSDEVQSSKFKVQNQKKFSVWTKKFTVCQLAKL
jgi:hypothetical protein